MTEGSGEWAYHWSEHRNVRTGLIITRFTFLRSLARILIRAHVYNMEQSIVFRCALCDRELPNSKKRRDLLNTAHLLSAAVQLLRDCDPSGLISGGDAESMLKASKGSRHVSYVCTWPCYSRLERMNKLESELKSLKEELKDKLKATHRAELRKRINPAENPAEVGSTAMRVPVAKKRLVFTQDSAASPAVTVRIMIMKIN